MNHFAPMTPALSSFEPTEALQIQSTLVELDRALGALTATADREFLAVGDALGQSVAVFGRLSGDLAGLTERLHSRDAAATVSALEDAVADIGRMAATEETAGPILDRLAKGSATVATRLGVLRGIIGEVSALAVNGKILAAQVAATGVDFSVFTKEIGRLARLAAISIEQASEHLDAVLSGVASAQEAAANFEHNEAKELEVVRARINASLSVLTQRRERAAKAASAVAAKSMEISRHIGDTVGELQINDSVCQRLEHVRQAISTVAALVADGATSEQGSEWLNDLAEDQRRQMIGGICRLQAAQLDGGAGDYLGEVENLAQNLRALAGDAVAIRAEAQNAFGGQEGGLFIVEITQDIRRAKELLDVYASARDRTRAVVRSVSEGFSAMAGNLATIQSIDSDMRVMGLNATLKCGRLGDHGRALGVVAHELRSCSRRTEDCAKGIGQILEQVLTLSDTLSASAAGDREEQCEGPVEAMSVSLVSLTSLGDSLASTLTALQADTDSVSSVLTETAEGIDVHRRVGAVSRTGVERLTEIAERLAGDTDLGQIQQHIGRLVLSSYTMDSERSIFYQIFGNGEPPPPSLEGSVEAGDSIDDLFF